MPERPEYTALYNAVVELVGGPEQLHETKLFEKLLKAREELIEEGRQEIRRELRRLAGLP